ncbi:CRISPR-associated helicase/endonuclease Cas3 [Syntrophomonas curvata]
MRIIRDICDHHSKLRDIEPDCPWHATPNSEIVFKDMDIEGFHRFLCHYYTEFVAQPAPSSEQLLEWKEDFKKIWHGWQSSAMSLNAKKLAKLMNIDKEAAQRLLSFRDKTASFITGDRYDAGRIGISEINKAMAQKAITVLEQYCLETGERQIKKNPDAREMVEKRQEAQAQSLQQYRNNTDKNLFSLALATGLGKTLTSMRIALEACRNGKSARIIYVAPYISILSQATNEIIDSTELEVLQHHHLSVLNAGQLKDNFDDRDLLIMESWQALVVTTTFNQLFKALFPEKAQNLIRLPAMQDAFIIIDEPQIIDSQVWNLFLAQLETAVTKYNCNVLFISATLPPFEFGLQELPYPLSVKVETPARYIMNYSDNVFDEQDVAHCLVNSDKQKVATVLNTVRDTCEVFKNVKGLFEEKGAKIVLLNSWLEAINDQDLVDSVFLVVLNGYMTPLHKEFIINAVNHALDNYKSVGRIIVISTQVIEAGVNMSFEEALRALGIMPSHIQFAGRVNRHGEMTDVIGKINIVNFKRGGETDSRKWVYLSENAREETDKLMERCHPWDEKTCIGYLKEYYINTFDRNREQALLGYYEPVARGEWSLFAGIEPFGKSYQTYPIFIPWPDKATMLNTLDYYEANQIRNSSIQRILSVMEYFQLEDVEDIYDMYLMKEKMAKLNFVERKQFMALMEQFEVQVGENLIRLGQATGNSPITRLLYKDLYSLETGLGHHVGDEDRELDF